MNLRDLEYLVAVADARSFRAAATNCGVSQPTLSVQIKKLETELGVYLVDRTANPVSITPVGEKVVERARLALEEVKAVRAIALAETGLPHSVRLGMFPTLGPYLAPHVLPGLRKALPGVEVLLAEDKSASLLASLEAGKLDAALVALPVENPRLHALPLFREEFVLAAPTGHPVLADCGVGVDDVAAGAPSAAPASAEAGLAGPARVNARNLEGAELLLLSAGHCLGDQVREWVEANGSSYRGDYMASSLESMRHMVAAGNITLLPALAVAPPVAATPGVELRRFAADAPSRDIALVWLDNSPRTELWESLAATLVPKVSALPEGMIQPL
ncbi:LysR substrate-binding domain-containing protein [Buchananella felis]|uniref:LysR substrate-binding domain-containing protein n=1 Tax=Buchananella felis TaxID=3231492 RepID=UPI00352914C5